MTVVCPMTGRRQRLFLHIKEMQIIVRTPEERVFFFCAVVKAYDRAVTDDDKIISEPLVEKKKVDLGREEGM